MKTRTLFAVLLALFVLAGGAQSQDWGGASTQNAYNDLTFASDLVGAGATVSGTAYKIVGGPTQSVMEAGSNARCVWMNPSDLNSIWVGLAYPARIAKSTNDGTSWTTVPVVLAGGDRPNSAVYQIFATGGTMLAQRVPLRNRPPAQRVPLRNRWHDSCATVPLRNRWR